MGGSNSKKEFLVKNNLVESIRWAVESSVGHPISKDTAIDIILALDYKGWEFIYTKEYANDNNKEE